MAKTATTQDSILSVKSAEVGTQIASFLVPDYMKGQKLAIVDEGVLDFLTKLLPTASFSEIKHDFIQNCREMDNLEALVKLTKDFVAFHETCNLLKRYFDPHAKIEMEKPFNASPKPLTYAEMKLKEELMQNEMEELMKMMEATDEWKEEHSVQPYPVEVRG